MDMPACACRIACTMLSSLTLQMPMKVARIAIVIAVPIMAMLATA